MQVHLPADHLSRANVFNRLNIPLLLQTRFCRFCRFRAWTRAVHSKGDKPRIHQAFVDAEKLHGMVRWFRIWICPKLSTGYVSITNDVKNYFANIIWFERVSAYLPSVEQPPVCHLADVARYSFPVAPEICSFYDLPSITRSICYWNLLKSGKNF